MSGTLHTCRYDFPPYLYLSSIQKCTTMKLMWSSVLINTYINRIPKLRKQTHMWQIHQQYNLFWLTMHLYIRFYILNYFKIIIVFSLFLPLKKGEALYLTNLNIMLSAKLIQIGLVVLEKIVLSRQCICTFSISSPHWEEINQICRDSLVSGGTWRNY